MADEGGKPPAGRGAGRGQQRKAKFAPTVPSQRRRKAEEPGAAGAATTAAEAAAANEAFQDLIRAAQTDAKWQRGRGRGYGRGRGVGSTQVMFGGDGGIDSRRTAATPQPRAACPKGESKAKGEGASSSRSRLKPNVKGDSKPGNPAAAAAAAAGGYYGDADFLSGDEGSSEECQDPAVLFDFEQYTPTTLPLSLHHPHDAQADSIADAAVMRHGLPDELALRPDNSEGGTAEQLGLTDLSTAQDTLYLFQLPSMLPLGLPPADAARKGGRQAPPAAAAAAGAGSSSGGQQQALRAATARELPSGPVGKLLVFKSGRVKLQMGSCLLDVSAGMPCVSRQDVAAINKTTGHLIQLGPVTQRAVVCPDVWQLMANQPIPPFARDLQQQQQLAAAAAAAAAANGGPANGSMEVDADAAADAAAEGLADDDMEGEGAAVAPARARGRKKQQQVVLEESEEDGEDGQQPQQQQQHQGGVKVEQQQRQNQQDQQQQQQQRRQRRTAQQIGSSSEDDGAEGEGAAAKGAAAAGAAAAAGTPPKQPQQQQLVGNGTLGWLDVPAAPAARGGVAGRGRGKFRPSTRSPSPAAATMPPGGAAAQQADAMDVGS